VLFDGENGIIAGHGRVLAARKLGMSEVPCIELAHLSPVLREGKNDSFPGIFTLRGWSKFSPPRPLIWPNSALARRIARTSRSAATERSYRSAWAD
jgi:hypothetical protein